MTNQDKSCTSNWTGYIPKFLITTEMKIGTVLTMKISILLFLLFICFDLQSQILYDNSRDIKEFNFFYLDSANNEYAYADYKPTSLISLNDGSLVVSTEFSISFPGQYKTPTKFDSEYFEKQKIYRQKSHVSSGSIFKLNGQFEKQWDIEFRNKRVKEMRLCNDNTIIAVGEKVELNKFWIALINLDGKVIWENEIRNKSHSFISDILLDSLNNLYVLIESERLIPFKIRKLEFGTKRLEFFKTAEMDGDLYLMKFTHNGNKVWESTLDRRKSVATFGYNLILGENKIYASSSYESFKRHKNKINNIKGDNIFDISTKGRILNKSESAHNRLLFYENGLISCTQADDDTLKIMKNSSEINSILLPEEIKTFWIEKGIHFNNNYYLFGSFSNNLGYLLIKLSENYEYKGYWNNSGDRNCQPSDFIILQDGTLIIIGEKWIKKEDKNIRFINIQQIKNKN